MSGISALFPESPGFRRKSPEKKSGYSELFPGVSGVSGEKVRRKSPDTPGFFPEKSPE
jgi:hypothetical protein